MTGIDMIPSSSSTRLRAGAETFLVNDHSFNVDGERDGKSGWKCLASDRRVFCGGRSRYSRAELQSDDKKAIWTEQKCKPSGQSNLGGKSQLSKASNTLLSKLKSFIFSGEAKVG